MVAAGGGRALRWRHPTTSPTVASLRPRRYPFHHFASPVFLTHPFPGLPLLLQRRASLKLQFTVAKGVSLGATCSASARSPGLANAPTRTCWCEVAEAACSYRTMGPTRRPTGIVALSVGGLLLALTLTSCQPRESPEGESMRVESQKPTLTTVALPGSMAAIGDSITQAAALDDAATDGASLSSWATGYNPADPIKSHYERLLAEHPRISSRRHNNSVSGARMVDALEQAKRAVFQRVDYVTFLMGANDLCAPSPAVMTSVSDFERQFKRAIAALITGLPRVRVYVLSIPNIYRLWTLFRAHPFVPTLWNEAEVCPAMLAGDNSQTDRQRVRRRNIEFNEVLRKVCQRYARCRFDGNAVFNYPFTAEHVSSLDYFHPSRQGQKALAEISWRNGYWPQL